MRLLYPVLCLLAGVVPACSDPVSSGDSDAAEDQARTFTRVFPTVSLGAGQENTELCASWTVNNATTAFVNRVEMQAGPGWHHSNWFFVSDSTFEGPDGIWPCEERNFDPLAVAVGGGTLFAQSTQSRSEVQQFGQGVALQLPSNAKVVGQLHLLNAGDTPIETSLQLDVSTIPEASVQTRLQPMAMQYTPLNILPQQRSRFTTECDLQPHLDGNTIDFNIHYVLPHYHELGVGASIEVIGGERDGEAVFVSNSPVGEPWGARLDPPVELQGATGLRFRCEFDNPRDQRVGWGFGDQEMCVIFAFTDSALRWAGDVRSNELRSNDGEMAEHEGECALFALTPWT